MASKKALHAHGCTSCRTRYEDVCDQPHSNGECSTCRGLEPWSLLIASRVPKDCCRAHSRACDKSERETYQLSNACDWWRCLICCRTQPFNPENLEMTG